MITKFEIHVLLKRGNRKIEQVSQKIPGKGKGKNTVWIFHWRPLCVCGGHCVCVCAHVCVYVCALHVHSVTPGKYLYAIKYTSEIKYLYLQIVFEERAVFAIVIKFFWCI